MRREDIPQVNEIDREAFTTQWPPPDYKRELKNLMAHYIVACDETKLAEQTEMRPAPDSGSLLSKLTSWFHRQQSVGISMPSEERLIAGFAGIWLMVDEAHITNIAVRKQYQRRGIGELLLIYLIELAKEMNASIMTLEVRASNTAAQNLYRKYSFAQMGIRRGYYTDNREDGIIMSTQSIISSSFQEHFQQLKQAHARRWGITRYELASRGSTLPDRQ